MQAERNIIRSLITLFFAFSIFSVFAQQNRTLEGKITDKTSSEILPGATILIKGSGAGTSADLDGEFVLKNIREQKITLIASFVGYESQEVDVDFGNSNSKKINIKLKPSSTQLEQVQIEGKADGQVKAFIEQKKAANIKNIVSSEQIEQFPDMNAAEAMQRIPGITLQRDQGEGRYIQLRGTPPEYTNFNVNGEQVPSPEGGVRYVGMDIISADQIDFIEVSKVLTPDMDADGIAGSVNIITKKAESEEPEIKTTLAGGYSNLRETGNYQVQFLYGQRKNKIGFLINASHFYNKYGSDNMEFRYAKGPFWGSTGQGQDNYFVQYREFQLRHYDITRARTAISATLDYEFNKNSYIYLRGMINRFTDEEIRRRKIYDLEDALSMKYYLYGGIVHDVKDRLKIQGLNTINVGGKHKINKLDIDYEVSYAYATESEPDRMESGFENPGQAIAMKFNLEDPQWPRIYYPNPENAKNAYEYDRYDLDELIFEDSWVEDQNYAAKINFKIPYALGLGSEGFFKFGGKTRIKRKQRDINATEYGGFDTVSNLYPGKAPMLSLETIHDGFYDGNLLDHGYELEYMPGPEKLRQFFEFYPQFFIIDRDETRENSFNQDYLAHEYIYAAYAMFQHHFNKLMILGGVRFEKTDIEYEGRMPIRDSHDNYLDVDTLPDKRSHDIILPQFQLKYSFTEDLNIRFAATYTFVRPNFEDVIPFREEDRDEVHYGNPNLKFPKALNIDLLAEKYLVDGGIISGGLFYKNIDNFIFYGKGFYHEDSTLQNSIKEVTIPQNGKEAFVYGAELQTQFKFSFLPGIFRNFGIYTNYTFTHSEATIFKRPPANYSSDYVVYGGDYSEIFDKSQEEKIPLPGQAKHAVNVAFFYDAYRFYAKLSANYHDAFLYELGADDDLDIYYDKAFHLDFTANFALNKHFKVFTDVINLTNAPLRFYLDNPDQVSKKEFYSWSARLGIKIDL